MHPAADRLLAIAGATRWLCSRLRRLTYICASDRICAMGCRLRRTAATLLARLRIGAPASRAAFRC